MSSEKDLEQMSNNEEETMCETPEVSRLDESELEAVSGGINTITTQSDVRITNAAKCVRQTGILTQAYAILSGGGITGNPKKLSYTTLSGEVFTTETGTFFNDGHAKNAIADDMLARGEQYGYNHLLMHMRSSW